MFKGKGVRESSSLLLILKDFYPYLNYAPLFAFWLNCFFIFDCPCWVFFCRFQCKPFVIFSSKFIDLSAGNLSEFFSLKVGEQLCENVPLVGC